jgi:hypothetical protein
MKCLRSVVVAVALTAFGLSDCASTTKVGLSSARAKEWRQARANTPGDAVANGDDSCEREGSKRPDPTPIRVYRCPGESPVKHSAGIAQLNPQRR